MKRGIFVFGILFLILSVFVSALNDSSLKINSDENIKKITENYVKKFAEKKGINEEDIKNISQVDFNSLPESVDLKNIGETNLGIYQIEYNKANKSENLFVITYSSQKIESLNKQIISNDKTEILDFGFSEISYGSEFLKTATGVDSSLEKGYVMMRDGSITGISTNLEVLNSAENEIEIIIYKNGEEINFRNSLIASEGIQIDFDTQSKGVVNFEKGDVISARLISEKSILWGDVITRIELTM